MPVKSAEWFLLENLCEPENNLRHSIIERMFMQQINLANEMQEIPLNVKFDIVEDELLSIQRPTVQLHEPS